MSQIELYPVPFRLFVNYTTFYIPIQSFRFCFREFQFLLNLIFILFPHFQIFNNLIRSFQATQMCFLLQYCQSSFYKLYFYIFRYIYKNLLLSFVMKIKIFLKSENFSLYIFIAFGCIIRLFSISYSLRLE